MTRNQKKDKILKKSKSYKHKGVYFMEEKILAGIDFGTSNSLIAIAKSEKSIHPIEMHGGDPVIPTALFFDGRDTKYGHPAITSYLNGSSGRFMRGIKSLLGTKAEKDGTYVYGKFYTFSNLVRKFLWHVKTDTEEKIDAEIENVVMGRPVHFNNDPIEDNAAEKCLEKICHGLGFKNVSFQYEPIAAALHYEQTIQSEELTLVADLGGGTSDFSVVRLSPDSAKKTDRTSDILSNDSVHVAGTDLDKATAYTVVMPHFGKNSERKNGLPIPYAYFVDACEWHQIKKLYTTSFITDCETILREAKEPKLFNRYLSMIKNKQAHYMLFEVEAAKICLSSRENAEMDLCEIEPDFYLSISKKAFLGATNKIREEIISKAKETIQNSGVNPNNIQNIIYTGGTSLVPEIAQKIQSLCPNAKSKKISTYASVGSGLALEALRRYGRERQF